ncbi:ATP-binding protein [Streptomyces thermolineatus]|uniref:ATP-binding protein n=1 Tax=Streptomyces thermolineatus TaxID=44033 RepID=UPI00384A8A32
MTPCFAITSSERAFPRHPYSVRAARDHAAAVASRLAPPPPPLPAGDDRLDDVLVCVSELATNALVHGAPPDCGFLLRIALVRTSATGAATLRVEVHDDGKDLPPQDPDRPLVSAPGREGEPGTGGRGLLLVSALADAWGVSPFRGGAGKAVWAEFRFPREAAGKR